MKIHLLQWLWGFASLYDGLIAIFTLGIYRPSTAVIISTKLLKLYCGYKG